ncbi:MAG: bifunctional riboflavin kinase/FAD synthetase [Candidatus Cloacimonadaceae bacterium]|jgi:riboflavin kinase/FMN adenylyltransferase|nr:bifunctional riboflavin kinase/FAD synthetase [Candidatus Cloacimonadota bacterium]MDY0128151.1 bifunctional riboflavin kinase/FAD synthetase [Candidatus Cloacimonadaceae bacterium]MCB5254440.1 bifunctional riboflavin kinase/FAD synthetase [Candidatus Cloacimonadota bacterium]MCK9178419.1 bifunctional riboflavin kinase/FAD synthetase [Candidatus Cloacimonadota bacterium]MCK9242496.1 bifunctional riboflavin kinase/FAD synthetase [Candidatus Cloacimonadota bacterium]
MTVLSIGTFDGIHLGHRKLLARVQEIARAEQLKSVIVTYRNHPAFTLNKSSALKLLCPPQIKEQELSRLGIDEIEMLNFTPELAQTSAYDFLSEYLIPAWQPRVIVMGYDSHFGKGREGDRQFLQNHASEYGYRVEYVQPALDAGKPISSSLIRRLLQTGNLQEANRLLGRAYCLLGSVCHGQARGRGLGFPTANLTLASPHQLIPAEGIYLSRVHLRGKTFFGLTNIGKSPTLKHSGITEVETFIIGFDSEIYGSTMQVELLKYLREEKMFANSDELIRAMKHDLARAQSLIKEMGCKSAIG